MKNFILNQNNQELEEIKAIVAISFIFIGISTIITFKKIAKIMLPKKLEIFVAYNHRRVWLLLCAKFG